MCTLLFPVCSHMCVCLGKVGPRKDWTNEVGGGERGDSEPEIGRTEGRAVAGRE